MLINKNGTSLRYEKHPHIVIAETGSVQEVFGLLLMEMGGRSSSYSFIGDRTLSKKVKQIVL
jgi:hypothetical protein